MTEKEIKNKECIFWGKEHRENDPSTLFTGSGMQPMVPYLLGEKHPIGNEMIGRWEFRANENDYKKSRLTLFGIGRLLNWGLIQVDCISVRLKEVRN